MPKKVSRRARRTRIPKVRPLTVWQALNEPVVEVSQGFAKVVLVVAVVMLAVAWVSPYWGAAKTQLPAVSYDSALLLEKVLPSQMSFFEVTTPENLGLVAGVETASTPRWYETAKVLPQELCLAVAYAANQVLDVSAPVAVINEFYRPGFHAVNQAWLELMADPY